MIFKNFISFYIVILIATPLFVFASPQDYLFVSFDYNHTTNVFNNISADQRVVDPLSVAGQDVGDYIMTLEDSQGIISQAKFFIPDPTKVETESLGNDAGAYGSPEYYSTTIGLALTRPVHADGGTLAVSHNGQILLSQKLSDTPIIILKSSSNSIIMPITEPIFPPYPADVVPSQGKILLWIVLGIIGLAVVSTGVYLFIRKSRNSQLPPAVPPEDSSLQ